MNRWFQSKQSQNAQPDDGLQPVAALPASWYRSTAMYELERRAIFSRRWLLVSHRARFVNLGDYIQITEAGFTFFLIKDRQGQVRAHHNLCRHRAYPLVENEAGNLNILACKYHGMYNILTPFSTISLFISSFSLLVLNADEYRMVLRL